MHFGLVGKSLSHSFSKKYFDEKFVNENKEDFTFSNFELKDISEFPDLMASNKNITGLSVTVPYKELVIPYLNELDVDAKEIGAVNCIHIINGKLIGYNTDVYGFRQSIKPFLEPKHNSALIFGTGGSSKAIAAALKKIGVEYYFVTSSSIKKTANTFFYSELNEMVMSRFLLLINCTPLGMFPDVMTFPEIPYEYITENHLAYDLVYNPQETLFLKKCREKGAAIVNGLSMLHQQAERNWEIWTNKKKDL